MQISELRNRVSLSLVGFAWDEWAQIGVFAEARRLSPWAIDPEMLLVFTLQVARDDPRLFDEVLDWVAHNANLLSLQRLRNLYLDDADRRLIEAALTWAAEDGARIKPLQAEPATLEPERVFYSLGPPIRTEPAFLGFGLLKPPTTRSGKSSAPNMRKPVALAFALRRIFGVGSRAEVVRFLLTTSVPSPHGRPPLATTAAIADACAYAKRNVQDALAGLVEAGVVEQVVRGREHLYRLDPEPWRALLPAAGEHIWYRDWPNALTAFKELHRWLSRDDLDDLSAYLRASEARRLMRSIEPSWTYAGIVATAGADAHGSDYWDVFVDAVERALGQLESGFPF